MDALRPRAYVGLMVQQWLIPAAVVALTVVAMELTAAAVHRHVMHGWGWGWHRSHHESAEGFFERNDLYALVFAGLSLPFFLIGAQIPLLWWVGAGMAVYGLLYAFVHDGLVHRRFPFVGTPRNGYLKRLVQAHRLHHSTHGREGAVSFGFLYAPPVKDLVAHLRARRPGS